MLKIATNQTAHPPTHFLVSYIKTLAYTPASLEVQLRMGHCHMIVHCNTLYFTMSTTTLHSILFVIIMYTMSACMTLKYKGTL